MATDKTKTLVGILMGSKSDWDVMQHCAAQLEALKVPWEAQAISAHRAPDALFEYLSTAIARGLEVIIAAAGGAAHLPGFCAAKTSLPVLGVPMESPSLKGLDSLLSIVQMPGGVPVGTLAIGKPGAINAALLAVSILGVKHPQYRQGYEEFRKKQTEKVLTDRVLKLPHTQPGKA
jgi:5-(carboxyamino)imidazole ribonucleotide mutase